MELAKFVSQSLILMDQIRILTCLQAHEGQVDGPEVALDLFAEVVGMDNVGYLGHGRGPFDDGTAFAYIFRQSGGQSGA